MPFFWGEKGTTLRSWKTPLEVISIPRCNFSPMNCEQDRHMEPNLADRNITGLFFKIVSVSLKDLFLVPRIKGDIIYLNNNYLCGEIDSDKQLSFQPTRNLPKLRTFFKLQKTNQKIQGNLEIVRSLLGKSIGNR